MVSLTKKTISNSIKIKSDLDENIVGTLFNSNYDDERMFELYEFYIPYDAESIDIECKLENTKLLIYVKDKQIDLLNSDFQVFFGQITSISKDEIIQLKGFNSIGSIEKLAITICVYAEKNYFTDIAYSFKVHLNKNNKLKIYKLGNEEKALCKPNEVIEDKYRCLFMIVPQNLNLNNYLCYMQNHNLLVQ